MKVFAGSIQSSSGASAPGYRSFSTCTVRPAVKPEPISTIVPVIPGFSKVLKLRNSPAGFGNASPSITATTPPSLGYDLLNEPIPHFPQLKKYNSQLEPLYRRITKAIREVDPDHLIFIGGAQWDSNFQVFGPPFDSKLVYQFHKYWTAPSQDVIQEYLDFRGRYDVPIWLGESGENTDQWIADFVHTLPKRAMSAGASGHTRRWRRHPASLLSQSPRIGMKLPRSQNRQPAQVQPRNESRLVPR